MMFVFYMLSVAVFNIVSNQHLRKKFLLPYLCVIIVLLLITVIHSLAVGNMLSCESHSFSLHWYVNSVISISNVVLGFWLLNMLREQQRHYGSIVHSKDLLHKNMYNTIKMQMQVLIWNCLIFSILEIILIIIGYTVIYKHLR